MKHKKERQFILSSSLMLISCVGAFTHTAQADPLVIGPGLSIQTGDKIVLQPKGTNGFACMDAHHGLPNLEIFNQPSRFTGFDNMWCIFEVEVVDPLSDIIRLKLGDIPGPYSGRYLKRFYADRRYIALTPNTQPDPFSTFKVTPKGGDLVELQADNNNYVVREGSTITVKSTGASEFHLYTSPTDVTDGSPQSKTHPSEFMAGSQNGLPSYNNQDGHGEYQLIEEQASNSLSVLAFERKWMPSKEGAALAFEYKNCSAGGKPGSQSEQYSTMGLRLGDGSQNYLSLDFSAPDSRILPIGNNANGIDILFDDTGSRSVTLQPHQYSDDIFTYVQTAQQYTNCQYQDVVLQINAQNQLSLDLGSKRIFSDVQLNAQQVANIYDAPVVFFAGDNAVAQNHTSHAIRNIRYAGIDAQFSANTQNISASRSNSNNPSEFSLLATENTLPATQSIFLPPADHAEFGFEFDYRICTEQKESNAQLGLSLSLNQTDVINAYKRTAMERIAPNAYGLIDTEQVEGMALQIGLNHGAKLIDSLDHQTIKQGTNQSLLADCTWHSAVIGTKNATSDSADEFIFGLYLSEQDADSALGKQNPNYTLSLLHTLSADTVYKFLSQPIGLHASSNGFKGSLEIRNLSYSQNLRIDEPHENLTTTQTILNVAEVSFKEDTDADQVANWYEDSRFNINTEPSLQGTNIYSFSGNMEAFAKGTLRYFSEYLTTEQKNVYRFYPQFKNMFHALQFNTDQATQQLGGHPKSRGNLWINAVGAYLKKLRASRVNNTAIANLSKQEELGKEIYLKTITPYINLGVEFSQGGVTLTNVLTQDMIDGYFSGTFLDHAGFAKVADSAKYIVQFTRFNDIAARQYGAGNFPIPTVKNPTPDWNEVENWRLFHRAEAPALWAYSALGLDVYSYASAVSGTTLIEHDEGIWQGRQDAHQFYLQNGHNGDKLYAAAQRAVAEYQKAYLPGAFGLESYEPLVRAAHYVRRAYQNNMLDSVDFKLFQACTTSEYDYELVKNCFYPQLQADLNKVKTIRQRAISDFITQKGSKGYFGGFADWLMILLPVAEEIRAMDLVSTFSAALEEEGLSMSTFAEEGIATLEEESASLEGALVGSESIEDINFAAFCPL